jgi:hypothetical protein
MRIPIPRSGLLAMLAATAATSYWSPDSALAFDMDPTSRMNKMSPMGRRAAEEVARITAQQSNSAVAPISSPIKMDSPICFNEARCPRGFRESAPGGQAELAIAVDESGKHIVIGFNDTRGFSANPVSVSGVIYSEDGGETFIDGGQLPSPANQMVGNTVLPQIVGDPEVKYLGDCVFIYSSIVLFKAGENSVVQSLGVHRSEDCGKTWEGPFEVTAASNPNGQLSPTGSPLDFADKEFMDVDPDTGRVMISWSNFTPFAPGGVEIRSAFTENLKTGAVPTWSSGVVVGATVADGQGSVPRFAAGSSNAYVAWTRFPFPGTFFGLGTKIAVARSLDNGVTFQPPVETAPEAFTMDQVLGNDRINTFPSLAVDNSRGKRRGTVYLVYSNNDNRDGADIVFQKSTDGAQTFSSPMRINAAPGRDRAQWFPYVTVDSLTGRVHVFFYDQGIDSTGDLTEVGYVFSDSGGERWSAPVPLTRRPFRAGWGNDTGQPNLGDYNGAVAQRGELFSTFAVTAPPPRGFVDGQPTSGSLTVPDVDFRRVSQFKFTDVDSLPLSIDVNKVQVFDTGSNGNLDPGELVRVRVPLENYTLNALSRDDAENVTAVLASSTPGVQILQPIGIYGKIAAGATKASTLDYLVRLASSFDPGTPIELRLVATGRFGGSRPRSATLRHTLFTGTPLETVLLTENFDSVAPGTLPAGWLTVHSGGLNIVPWTTTNTFCGNRTNAAFHQNADDNPGGDPTRIERLFSPPLAVPADADYLLVEFDICTDTEEDPNFNIQAFDGFLLRLFDGTPGSTPRNVLVEGFADEFTTGASKHYPRHLPRGGGPYFEDMSVWAGDSGGMQHVRLRLPGTAGTLAQLRFEYTQDFIGTCLDLGRGPICGVSFDNLVVKSVRSVAQPPRVLAGK